MLLAVRFPNHVSIMRRYRDETGTWRYSCICRRESDGAYRDFSEFRAEHADAVDRSVVTLEELECSGANLDPLRVSLLDNSEAVSDALGQTLILCGYADFMRYLLTIEADARQTLGKKPALPVDFKPIGTAFEALLDIDLPRPALGYISTVVPLLEDALGDQYKAEKNDDIFVGNAGYVLRMAADICERADNPALAAKALVLSHRIAPNKRKLARLVFLYERLEDRARLKEALVHFEKEFGLTDRMTKIRTEL
jgi:hypothetical protein